MSLTHVLLLAGFGGTFGASKVQLANQKTIAKALMNDDPVVVTLPRWAGQWGPFKVNIPCGECALTVDVLKDTFANELAGIPIELEDREWLTNWYKPLPKGGWHAPIVMVDGNIISQGNAPIRGANSLAPAS